MKKLDLVARATRWGRATRWCGAAIFLLALGCRIAASADAPAPATAPPRPNVVLFVADDHGLDAGCYGHPVVRTPHLDRLAAEGVRFDLAFCTTASCSPSRSVLLSGLHNHATGQYGLAHAYHHFSSFSSLRTLPVILAEHGYRTARVGKFHVMPAEAYAFQTVLPTAQGSRNPVRMAEACREFLADRRTPFLLYFCVTDPHRAGVTLTHKPGRPDSFGNHQAHPGVSEITYDPGQVVVPPWLPDTPECRAELAEYYQAVSRVDQGVGRLVQILRETGQYENTLFLYLSDNGAAMPGAKTTLYEPGIRLPLIVRPPGAASGGRVSRAMVSWVDITPTILDYAGVREVLAPPYVAGEPGDGERARPADAPRVPYKFHGRSFRPVLEAEPAEGWDEVFASHTFHEVTMYYPMRALRTRRYKLILNLAHPLPFPFASDLHKSATWQRARQPGDEALYGRRRIADFLHRPRYELYDLQTDPEEVVNLAGRPEHQALFQQLAARLKEHQERTGDPWLLKYQYE